MSDINRSVVGLLQAVLEKPGDMVSRLILADALSDLTDEAGKDREKEIERLRSEVGYWQFSPVGVLWHLQWYDRELRSGDGKITFKPITVCSTRHARINCRRGASGVHSRARYQAATETDWEWTCSRCLVLVVGDYHRRELARQGITLEIVDEL